ncbi:MAG: GerMN domain-containing protein [Synergistaceae bacterium]|nr:GerMN domain-containing protein [Synergistaceae bacterium]
MPRRVHKYRDEGNIWEEEAEYGRRRYRSDSEHPKAPLMLRVLTWTGIILLCFVGGYLGASWGIDFLNQKDLLVQDDVAVTSEDLKKIALQENNDVKKLTLKLSYPKDGNLISENFELIPGIKEQEIKETIERLLSVSKMFSKEVSAKHIFRNANTLYINFTGPFIPMLSNAGKEQSTLLVNGLVRTMTENFPPIKEVRFLVNGGVTTAGSPIDLTAIWK